MAAMNSARISAKWPISTIMDQWPGVDWDENAKTGPCLSCGKNAGAEHVYLARRLSVPVPLPRRGHKVSSDATPFGAISPDAGKPGTATSHAGKSCAADRALVSPALAGRALSHRMPRPRTSPLGRRAAGLRQDREQRGHQRVHHLVGM